MQRFMHRALLLSLRPSLDRTEPLKECVEALKKLREARPDLGTAMMNLHWAQIQLGDAAGAAATADEFAAGAWKEPQAVSYFARALSERKLYDAALKLLDRAPVLEDYLGDEIGRERMRALAGKGDVRGAVAAFARRIGEVKADLDQFHFAYHVFSDMDLRFGDLPQLLKRIRLGFEPGDGFKVGRVEPDGPAARAGLVEGDVITEFDGKAPAAWTDLTTLSTKRKIGEEVALKVARGRELKLTLESELLREFRALADVRDAEGKRRLTYVTNVGDLLSRILGPDAHVELLQGAVDEFKGVFGFRHYMYRTALRILETKENPKPD